MIPIPKHLLELAISTLRSNGQDTLADELSEYLINA